MAKTMNGVALGCLVVSLFSGFLSFLSVFYWIGLLLIVYNTYRMFSRNIAKRQAENQKFRQFRYQMAIKKDGAKKQWEQRKVYRFFKCPGCSQKVRVPKGRGKICITCPKCKTEFIKKS